MKFIDTLPLRPPDSLPISLTTKIQRFRVQKLPVINIPALLLSVFRFLTFVSRLPTSDFRLPTSLTRLPTSYIIIIYFFLAGYSFPANAQNNLEYPGSEEGIEFKSADSSMQITFGARMQNRIEFIHFNNEATESDRAEFQVRRMRLKAGGYMIDPRLTFELQVAFSGQDVDGHPENAANILLDAMIRYAFTPGLSLQIGQFKLPGNRQRVISSQNLQLVDRSIVNSSYNLDRDAGLMLQYNLNLGKAQLRFLSAVSNGEGRNVLNLTDDINETGDLNLALTQRLEFLPFGEFLNSGDYFESDLLLEPTPRLAIGAGYSHNENAVRQRGQRGQLLFEPRDISTIFSDFIFKYRGWSVQGEYMQAHSKDPVTELDGENRAVEDGEGYMIQAGKILPSFWEVSARYAQVIPDEEVEGFQFEGKEILVGVSRYIRGHRIKVQSDIGYIVDESLPQDLQEHLQWRFQMELGF
jgi:phosphate-selective porin OprO/OprP